MLFYYSRQNTTNAEIMNVSQQPEGKFTYEEGQLLFTFDIYIWGMRKLDLGFTPVPAQYERSVQLLSLTSKYNEVILIDHLGHKTYLTRGEVKYLLKSGLVIPGLGLDGNKLISIPLPGELKANQQLCSRVPVSKDYYGCYVLEERGTLRLSDLQYNIPSKFIRITGYSKVTFILDGFLTGLSSHFINATSADFNQYTIDFVVEDDTKLEVVLRAVMMSQYKARTSYIFTKTSEGEHLHGLCWLHSRYDDSLKWPNISYAATERIWNEFYPELAAFCETKPRITVVREHNRAVFSYNKSYTGKKETSYGLDLTRFYEKLIWLCNKTPGCKKWLDYVERHLV